MTKKHNNRRYLGLATLISLVFATGHAYEQSGTETPAADTSRAQITTGNGEKNWIIVDDVKRNAGTLTFSEVRIDGNGWLVIHPFENGAPNGDKYVGSTYLKDGTNKDVDIEVYKGLTSGEMFIVMLHRDVNENKILDFVFVDDRNVMDTAVFEGNKMIGHAIPAPPTGSE